MGYIIMQIKLTLRPPEPVVLPLGHHHILQAIVYKLIGQGSEELHDHGAVYGDRQYKMFTFGELKGHYVVNKGRISFDDHISWEVRSIDDGIIESISENLYEGIFFGNTHVSDIAVKISETHVADYDIEINMESPICIRHTDVIDRGESYCNPSEIDFYRGAEDNFIRKYTAYAGEFPKEKIVLSQIKVGDKDRIVSKYKNGYIESYGGKYRLVGRPEYLDFLYQTGLGSRNSQGFGMFSVVD